MDGYEALEVIGSGSFGVIRKVMRKSDKRILVRKEIDYSKMSEKEKKQLVSEVNILRELRHPNIVRYYERFVDRAECRIYIIMEWCEGGDLAGIIKQCKKENKRIPEDVVWNLMTQLLLALQECHHGTTSGSTSLASTSSNGETKQPIVAHPTILHRDIKPDNVFLDGAQNVKLGDFGLSRIIANPDLDFAKTFVGTPFYMSPELVSETSYNTKSDIWALGCLIYELCALEPPFQSKTQAGLTQKIQQGRVDPLPSQYSPELMATIKAMLNVNYMKRPSTTEFLKLQRIRMCIKERAMLADMKKREDEVKKRESAVELREIAATQKEELLRRLWKELEAEKCQLGMSLESNAAGRNLSGAVSELGYESENVGRHSSSSSDATSATSASTSSSVPLSRRNSTPPDGSIDNPFTASEKKISNQVPDSTSKLSFVAATSSSSGTSSDTHKPKANVKTLARPSPNASSSVPSPSPFRRGIQLRTQQQPLQFQLQMVHGAHGIQQPQAKVEIENRRPADTGTGGYEKVALRAINGGGTGNVFRSGMTPRKNVEDYLVSNIGSPMQLSSP